MLISVIDKMTVKRDLILAWVAVLVQILEKGGHVNDRDSVSDMTLLHFACKAGAAGIGDPQVAAEVVQDLISRGADVFARCKWTQMTPLHYAALFDAAPIIQILVGASHALDIDGPCNDYENGGALHIAAANLALNAAVALVEAGANTKIKDNLGRTALGQQPSQALANGFEITRPRFALACLQKRIHS